RSGFRALFKLMEIVPPLAVLIAIAGIARFLLGSWTAPGAFFPLFWSALLLGSMLVPHFPIWVPALWWIDGTLLVFLLGSLAGQMGSEEKPRATPEKPRDLVLP